MPAKQFPSNTLEHLENKQKFTRFEEGLSAFLDRCADWPQERFDAYGLGPKKHVAVFLKRLRSALQNPRSYEWWMARSLVYIAGFEAALAGSFDPRTVAASALPAPPPKTTITTIKHGMYEWLRGSNDYDVLDVWAISGAKTTDKNALLHVRGNLVCVPQNGRWACVFLLKNDNDPGLRMAVEMSPQPITEDNSPEKAMMGSFKWLYTYGLQPMTPGNRKASEGQKTEMRRRGLKVVDNAFAASMALSADSFDDTCALALMRLQG